LALDPIESAASSFTFQVERLYAGLIQAVKPNPAADCEPGLGGKLLYAGKLDTQARAMVVAANIAGAASLAASADPIARKQFMRDGVVDFLVTSLDEALRILKNEIRKRETVAVCVALEPKTVEAEMLERGVVPDQLRPGADDSQESASFLRLGARRVEPAAPEKGKALLDWRVASSPAIWLPRLDVMAADCLQHEDGAARRWLRLAPRYLGRMAQGVRVLRCGESAAAHFLERVREEVERGEIGVAVELRLSRSGQLEQYSFAPPTG
jgi:hypothetical protein